ncbi:MAG: hypothetical protein HZB92_05555 [Euryarchaeota archaeon]|nr:hypothetical protein [Euryarchaeota archaeon]
MSGKRHLWSRISVYLGVALIFFVLTGASHVLAEDIQERRSYGIVGVGASFNGANNSSQPDGSSANHSLGTEGEGAAPPVVYPLRGPLAIAIVATLAAMSLLLTWARKKGGHAVNVRPENHC